MKPRILYFPCFVYSTSFLLIFFIYKMGWSDLYPELEGPLVWFLLTTIFLSFLLSIFQSYTLKEKHEVIKLSEGFIKRSILFILFGYTLEFLYERSIPLVSTIISSSFSYKDFTGIPTFHVILSTYNIFFSILIFEYYLCEKSKRNFLCFCISMVPFILVMNRGAFMIVLSAILFVFLMKIKVINIKTVMKICGILLGVFFLFGVIGNVRQEQTKEDKEYLLRIGGASEKFIESGIPNEYYWSYIYIISPLGNLQNIVKEKKSDFEIHNIPVFAATELLPDFISKRVSSSLLSEKELDNIGIEDYLVTPVLNAPTIYYSSFFFLGYTGLIIMFLVLMISGLIYPMILPSDSSYYVTAIASLNAIILLCTFNNMFFATGTILFWPLILNFIDRIKLKSDV